MSLPVHRLSSVLMLAVGYLSPQMALAEEAAPPASVEATPKQESFVSQGQPLTIDSLGIVITPPGGWEVSTNTGSLSVVMREPRKAEPDYEHPKYQKNITIAAIHNASPIDEKRAKELEDQLTRAFSADKSLVDFTVTEHKFFNYHGTNDGLLVYSTYTLGEFPMQQMHVLVSGQAKQFLMTYTDLASSFGSEKDAAYAAAWESMVSVQVTGDTPSRQAEYMRYGAVGGAGLLLLLLGGVWRFRAHRVDYKGEADAMIDAEEGQDYVSKPAHSALDSSHSSYSALSHISTRKRKAEASSEAELISNF